MWWNIPIGKASSQFNILYIAAQRPPVFVVFLNKPNTVSPSSECFVPAKRERSLAPAIWSDGEAVEAVQSSDANGELSIVMVVQEMFRLFPSIGATPSRVRPRTRPRIRELNTLLVVGLVVCYAHPPNSLCQLMAALGGGISRPIDEPTTKPRFWTLQTSLVNRMMAP